MATPELAQGLNPNVADATIDPDGDRNCASRFYRIITAREPQ
jgi:hypothetical protein